MPRGTSPTNFPVPTAGLIANVPLHQVPPNGAADGSNVFVDTDGLLKPRGGFTPLAPVGPGGRIMGGIGFKAVNGTPAGVVANLTEWWSFQGTFGTGFGGGSWVNITDPANPQNGKPDLPARFIAYFQGPRTKVFTAGVNGVDPMRAWAPGNPTYVTVAAAPIARDICAVGSRAMVIYTTEPNPDGPVPISFPFRVRWSSVDDGTSWPPLATNDLFDSDTPLVACRTFGRLTAAIYAENSVWLAVGQSGDDATAFGFQQIPGYTSGPMSSACVIVVDNLHYYFGRDYRIWRFDGVHCDPISAAVDAAIARDLNANSEFTSRIHGAFDAQQRRLIFWYPPGTADEPLHALSYALDYNRFEPIWSFGTSITTSFNSQRRNLLVPVNTYIGTADGQVHTFGRNPTDDNAPIPFFYTSALFRAGQLYTVLPESIELFFKYQEGAPECVKVSLLGYKTPGTPGTELWSAMVDVSEPDQFSRRITPKPNQQLTLGWPFLQLKLEGSSVTGGVAFMGADFFASAEKRPVAPTEDQIDVTCPPPPPPSCLFLLTDGSTVYAVDFNGTPLPTITPATPNQIALLPTYVAVGINDMWALVISGGKLVATHDPPAGAIISDACIPCTVDDAGETSCAFPCPDAVIVTLDVTFTATPPLDLTVTNYHWDFGDGSSIDTGTTPTASHTYSGGGTYNVVLTATTDTGDASTGSCPIELAGIVIECPDTVIDELGVDFTEPVPPGPAVTNYHWDFGDGNTTDTGATNTVHHDYTASGTYDVVVTVTTASGMSSSPSCPLSVVGPDGPIAPGCFSGDFVIDPTGSPSGGPVVVGPGTGASTCGCAQPVPDSGDGGTWVQYGVETFTRHGDPAGGAGAFIWLRVYDDDTCETFEDIGPINAGGSGGDINHCWHDENRGKTFVATGKRVGLLLSLFLDPDADGNEATAIPKVFVLGASEPPNFPGYSIDLGPC